jgi:fructose-1,6-bisphosphatase I
MKTKRVITLSQFIAEQQNKYPEASGDLSKIFRDIKLAAKIVNRDIRKAGLVDILGTHGTTNVQGEDVKKLDVLANEEFIASLTLGGECCAVISEEEEDIIQVNSEISADAKYIVAMDPLDGSSNIDVNAAIGTIFSIFKRKSPVGTPVTREDVLQRGTEQIAAGYVIYGSSTMLVYTTGQGVNGFTLDSSIGDFCLSHPDIQAPKIGTIYSINEGNSSEFNDGLKRYIAYCKSSANKKPFSARYIGSLVADFHRNLLKGGIFIYPATAETPKGKLRLMFEANPMAFIIEQAGGRATDGINKIMDIQPTDIHDRVPLYIGSEEMVLQVENMMQEEGTLM